VFVWGHGRLRQAAAAAQQLSKGVICCVWHIAVIRASRHDLATQPRFESIVCFAGAFGASTGGGFSFGGASTPAGVALGCTHAA
jgi:hypothetical protein